MDQLLKNIHVFPSEASYDKNIASVADSDLALVPLNMPLGVLETIQVSDFNLITKTGAYNIRQTESTPNQPTRNWGALFVYEMENYIKQIYVKDNDQDNFCRHKNIKDGNNPELPIGSWSPWKSTSYIPERDRPRFGNYTTENKGDTGSNTKTYVATNDHVVGSRDLQTWESQRCSVRINGELIVEDGNYHSREVSAVFALVPNGASVEVKGREFFTMEFI